TRTAETRRRLVALRAESTVAFHGARVGRACAVSLLHEPHRPRLGARRARGTAQGVCGVCERRGRDGRACRRLRRPASCGDVRALETHLVAPRRIAAYGSLTLLSRSVRPAQSALLPVELR